MPLIASKEFFDFCAFLHQDVVLLHGNEIQGIVRATLEHYKAERLTRLRAYLRDVLDGPYSDAELQALYRSTYTEIGIREDRGVRVFFKMICEIIDEKLGV